MTAIPPTICGSDDWLGAMPGHWQRTTIRAITRLVSEKRRPDLPLLSVYRDLGVIQRTAGDENHNVIPEDLTNYKVVRPGQLVLNKMKSWQGSLGVSEFEGIVSPAYIVCALRGGHNPRFVHYLLRSNPYVFAWKRISYGVRCDQWDMRYADFKQTPIFLPPRAEQDAIVAFVEAKQQDIETFIANKRRMIELLKEQKTALINRAVTRGINPKALLKPSGISWLPQIPQHWEIVPLKHLARIQTGVTLGATYGASALRSYPYLRVANVQSGYLDLAEIKKVDVPESEARGCKLQAGDVVMTEGGDFDKLGRGYVWRGEIPDCLHQNHIFAVRTDRRRLDPNFFAAELTGHHARTYFTLTSKKTTNLASTNKSKLGVLPVLLPPLEEQRQILEFINNEGSDVSKAIATAEREMELMAEYRTALIAAAVTGKIDVRQASVEVVSAPRPNRHFARALLSAEIVHQLHVEPTFGRIKHQKILHLCEFIGGIEEIQGEYHREAAGPLDNKLIYSVETELKKQKWFEEYKREQFGHGYRPLAKAGGHRTYVERYWKDKLPIIERLIKLMRTWDTERCEIFSTAYAAWNDLLIWRKPVTDDAIVHEILNRWHDRKRQVPESRWRKALDWMRKEGYVPTGFGRPTAKCATEAE